MERRFYDLRDGRISAIHFGDVSAPVKLVFAHANGFNGLSYRAVLEPLGVHVISLDLRGHGQSELPITNPKHLKNWTIFRQDICEFFDRYIETSVVLGGHSLGGASGIMAAPFLKDKLSGYVGLDPVTLPLLTQLISALPGARAYMRRSVPIIKNAGRRRDIFDNFEQAFERYQNRGAFKGIADDVLRDYLTGGLKPHPDGVQLCCSPLWEQAIFAAQGSRVLRHFKDLPENTHVIYGGKGSVTTPGTRAQAARILRGGMVTYRQEFHHLFPFQETAFTAEAIKAVLEKAKLKTKSP